MAADSQYTPLGAILNDIQEAPDLDGRDKQFLTQLFAMQQRASRMPQGKVRACRARIVKAVGGDENLRLLACLWLETSMGRLAFRMDGEGPEQRLDIKRIASKSGLDKRDVHSVLFLVAQSLPGASWSGFETVGGAQ